MGDKNEKSNSAFSNKTIQYLLHRRAVEQKNMKYSLTGLLRPDTAALRDGQHARSVLGSVLAFLRA
jgi:hypothetical protein